MNKKLEKFRRCYLQEIPYDQRVKENIKEKIGIVKATRLALTRSIKPYLLSAFVCFIGIVFFALIFSWGNYNTIPIYKGMTAENIVESDECSCDNLSQSIYSKQEDDVVIDNKIACHAHPNEEIIIAIKLYNPRNFTIYSFSLNDKVYYQEDFVEGSTPTKILVKFLVQDFPGTQNIKISNIKYLDRHIEKLVRFGGNKVIKLGISNDDYCSNVSIEETKQNNFIFA